MQSYGVHWGNNDTLLCLIAGVLLGTITGCRMFIFGKVTGISGFVSGLVEIKIKFDLDRLTKFSFLAGIVISGIISSVYLPDSFQDWSVLPVARLIIGGLLVGFGTTTGNGCTSGHGICGISAFRVRSLFGTCSFMLSGIVTAIAADTSSFLPVLSNSQDVRQSRILIGVSIAVCLMMLALAVMARTQFRDRFDRTQPLLAATAVIFECLFGVSFGLAMSVSNMTLLSATISFLDLRYWNPAQAFIMASAIAVTAPVYYLAGKKEFPFLDVKFHRPVGSVIDAKLVLGEVVFGVGWGLVGACPAPAITNLGSGNTPPFIYVACLIVGMWVQHYLDPYLSKALQSFVFYVRPVIKDVGTIHDNDDDDDDSFNTNDDNIF